MLFKFQSHHIIFFLLFYSVTVHSLLSSCEKRLYQYLIKEVLKGCAGFCPRCELYESIEPFQVDADGHIERHDEIGSIYGDLIFAHPVRWKLFPSSFWGTCNSLMTEELESGNVSAAKATINETKFVLFFKEKLMTNEEAKSIDEEDPSDLPPYTSTNPPHIDTGTTDDNEDDDSDNSPTSTILGLAGFLLLFLPTCLWLYFVGKAHKKTKRRSRRGLRRRRRSCS